MAGLSDDSMARAARRSPAAKYRTRSRTHDRTVISCSTTKGPSDRCVGAGADTFGSGDKSQLISAGKGETKDVPGEKLSNTKTENRAIFSGDDVQRHHADIAK